MIASSTLIGAKLGPYEIQSLLGHGGMSAVYQGFDTNLQRQVAIKVLADAVACQPGFADRFRQEARLLAGLCHPHIVQIYDYGEHAGAAYMVQELLPGPTLEQRLADLQQRDMRLSRDQIIAVAQQVASALDAAHAAGIIHRDIKPSNILWNAAGALVLADFGVAKALDAERLTQTGIVVGTPIYLSPEQAQGQALTPSSDIYSLGVVLYELIAGHPPFEGATSIGVALSHVQQPPPPLARSRADLPPAAEAVVLRALAKRPAARFRSASELAEALEQAWPSRAAFVSTTLSMLPTPRAAGALAGRLPTAARSLLPAAAVVLALLFGGARWLTLSRPVAPADAAPVLNMPTFAAFDPTSMPTGAALVAPPAATALVPAMLATPAPIAPPDQPVAIPVAAPAPASSAGQAPGQPAVSNAPAKPAGNQPATGAQPPKPKPPKPDKPKSPKPSDKGKGGGKGK